MFCISSSFNSIGKNSPYHSLADTSRLTKPQIVSKFYDSGSFISIPQKKFGETIKPGSITITDKDITDNAGNYLIIKDDGNGNLYSSNAHHSQSATTALSSSE